MPGSSEEGTIPKPGEVSLAHNGVLFLDELPEFERNVLEGLRQPVEDGKVTVARVAMTATFPSSFMLVAAMNPCEDVMRGLARLDIECTDAQRSRYYSKICGPLLDRIDIQVEVPEVKFQDMVSKIEGECSEAIRERVSRARERQRERFGGTPDLRQCPDGAERSEGILQDREGRGEAPRGGGQSAGLQREGVRPISQGRSDGC